MRTYHDVSEMIQRGRGVDVQVVADADDGTEERSVFLSFAFVLPS